jgi:hypothetical protein
LDIVPIEAVVEAIKDMAPAKKEENAQAALDAFNQGAN